jgi:hypothetical protein
MASIDRGENRTILLAVGWNLRERHNPAAMASCSATLVCGRRSGAAKMDPER